MEVGEYTKEQLETYDKWRIDIMSALSIIDDSLEKGLEKGRVEGLEKGRAEGEAIGIEKGKAEGRAEATINFCLKLFKKGISLEEIAELTGLPPKEITEILKNSD
jgi:predicted transposase/invertase (TIGR01784 family)